MFIELNKVSLLFCLIGFVLLANEVRAEPVAIVTDIAGTASIEVSAESRPVALLDNLEQGVKVSIDEASTLTIVYLDSGVEYKMAGPASFVPGVGAPEQVVGEQAEARSLKLLEETGLKPSEGNLNQAAIVFRNVHNFGGKIELLSPRDTKLLTDTPVFNWQSLGEGTDYYFELKSSRDRPVFAQELAGTELELPAHVELGNGRKYRWSVSAKLGNDSYAGSASFQMGSQREISNLIENQPGAEASFSERIVYSLVLRQQGFNHAAKLNWDKLVSERPEDPRLNSIWGDEETSD